jgi:hypothetical protein
MIRERVERHLEEGFTRIGSREFRALIDPDGIERVVEAMVGQGARRP